MERSIDISICMITHNEEKRLRRCLNSIQWAREIVLVDSGSQDQTLAIAKLFGCKIFEVPWRGYGPQKQFAVSKASFPWILSIDADEVVSPELRDEIAVMLKNPTFNAYACPRKNYIGEKWIRYGGWYPDYIIRLFRKEEALMSSDKVHEKVLTNGGYGLLKNPLLHFTSGNLGERLEKESRYSLLKADQIKTENHPWLQLFLRPIWKFLKLYFLQSGWRDGKIGFLLAATKGYGVLVTYAKLLARGY